ncbi:MAG: ABC transporter permease, partial [Gemmatimonadales bacterium]
MIGRLRDGVSVDRARRELDVVRNRLAAVYSASDGDWRVTVRPLIDELVGSVRPTLWLTFAAVGLVLLVACANVAGLLVARAIAREREFALRAVLGASRTRLVRQALAETLLLAAAGAVLALALADTGLRAILTASAGSLPRLEAPRVTGVTVAFTGALALLIMLLVGIVPGLHAGRVALGAALREGQRGSHGSRRMTTFRNALVVGEVALTMMLVVGSGLLARSFARLSTVSPGFSTSHVTTVRVALPDAAYPQVAQRTALLAELLRRLDAEPGIESAAAIDRLPLGGEGNWGAVNIVGRPALDAAHAPVIEGRSVSLNYLTTMGVRLLEGRAFTDQDARDGTRAAIVNETMAHAFWPAGHAVGARVVSAYSPADTTVVIGVASDVKDVALDRASPPEMYVPYTWWSVMNLVLRGRADAEATAALVRRNVNA